MAESIRCHQGNKLSIQQRELAMSYEKGAQTVLQGAVSVSSLISIFLHANAVWRHYRVEFLTVGSVDDSAPDSWIKDISRLESVLPDADTTSRRLMGSDNMQWCIKRRILAMAGFCIGQQECSHAVDESRDSNSTKYSVRRAALEGITDILWCIAFLVLSLMLDASGHDMSPRCCFRDCISSDPCQFMIALVLYMRKNIISRNTLRKILRDPRIVSDHRVVNCWSYADIP
nr:hypothetical protein CFP56_12121 [Quercus suber]